MLRLGDDEYYDELDDDFNVTPSRPARRGGEEDVGGDGKPGGGDSEGSGEKAEERARVSAGTQGKNFRNSGKGGRRQRHINTFRVKKGRERENKEGT